MRPLFIVCDNKGKPTVNRHGDPVAQYDETPGCVEYIPKPAWLPIDRLGEFERVVLEIGRDAWVLQLSEDRCWLEHASDVLTDHGKTERVIARYPNALIFPLPEVG